LTPPRRAILAGAEFRAGIASEGRTHQCRIGRRLRRPIYPFRGFSKGLRL
jgi:hypothetical protein